MRCRVLHNIFPYDIAIVTAAFESLRSFLRFINLTNTYLLSIKCSIRKICLMIINSQICIKMGKLIRIHELL